MKPNYLVVLIALVLLGCNRGNKSIEREVDSFLEMEFSKPDIYFESAVRNLENGDLASASEYLGDAISYFPEINYEEDTSHNEILEFAITELESVKENLDNGIAITVDSMNSVILSSYKSIIAYHLAIAQDYFWYGGENKEGLERLHRTLIKLESALSHSSYELTDEELEQLQSLRQEIAQAKKSSPALWKKVDEFRKQTWKFLKENTVSKVG